MPGPKSGPSGVQGVGKTRADKASGKHARRLQNRSKSGIRNSGGKEFGGKRT